MTDRTPVKTRFNLGVPIGLGEFESGDTVPIANGGTGATSAAGALTALGALPAANLIGSVIHVAKNAAPTGYLKANGAAVSRTTYAALFAVIGTTFGTGDGSTTFNLPDLRGEFVRGWDDSRGVDSGRSFGSAQAHATEALFAKIYQTAAYHASLRNNSFPSWTQNLKTSSTLTTAADTTSVSYGTPVAAAGSGETRPRNIALLACIRFL